MSLYHTVSSVQRANLICLLIRLIKLLCGAIVFVNLVSLGSALAVRYVGCPARLLIRPCSCIEKTKGLDISCEGKHHQDANYTYMRFIRLKMLIFDKFSFICERWLFIIYTQFPFFCIFFIIHLSCQIDK